MADAAQLEQLTTRDVLSLAAELQRGLIEREALKLVVAADWADRHCPASTDPALVARGSDGKVIPGSDRARLFGGDGTPEVMEFAPAELGIAFEMSRWQANRLIADALDLRHRLPRLWARVQAGQVPAWKACKIAAATRQLSQEAAAKVDADVCELVSRESWSRFCDILTGRIIAADPDLAQALADKAARSRYVRTGPTNQHGLKSIHAQLPQGDVLHIMAQVKRLAKIMGALGDDDSPDERRAKALAMLCDPEEVLGLVAASEGVDLSDIDVDDDNSGLMGEEGDGHYMPNHAKPYTPEDDYDAPPDPDLDPDLNAPPDDADDAAPAAHGDHPARDDEEKQDTARPGRPIDTDTGAEADSAAANRSAEAKPAKAAPSSRSASADDATEQGVEDSDSAHEEEDEGKEEGDEGEDSAHPSQGQTARDDPGPRSGENQQENSAHTGPSQGSQTGRDDRDTASGAHTTPTNPTSDTAGETGETDRPPTDPLRRENSARRRFMRHRPAGQGLNPHVARRILKAIAASGLDPTKLGPQIVLYHHYAHETLTDGNGTVRLEGAGAMTLRELRTYLSPFARITVKPVIDLDARLMPVDAYETPSALREQLHLRSPGDAYPWSSYTGRHVQMDHTLSYRPPHKGGPPGQTWLGGLAPLAVFSHRVKTHGGAQVRQPRPGTLVWRTRHGFVAITDHTGTHNLGTDDFAQAIWHSACTLNGEIEGRPTPPDQQPSPPPSCEPDQQSPSRMEQKFRAYFTRIPPPAATPRKRNGPVWN